jgi:hypothetical protein
MPYKDNKTRREARKGRRDAINSVKRAYYDVHKAEYSVHQARQYLTNTRVRLSTPHGRLRSIINATRRRAKRKGLPFNLSVDTVYIPTHCPVLGIEIDYGHKGSGPTNASPSIDRLVPELGYVIDNVVIMSFRANTIKNMGTIAEHKAVVKFMQSRGLC